MKKEDLITVEEQAEAENVSEETIKLRMKPITKMSKDYMEGYADGVSDIRNKLMMEIQDILECERDSYANGGETDKNLQGWIECLEMFKYKLIDKD